MLRIEKLGFAYDDLQVLWDVDLEVHRGEIVTVVGANGAGKSTILKNVSRLVKPTSGRILFEDGDLGHSEPHDVVGRGIVQVPEGRRIFPELTVLENLRMGSYLPGARKDRFTAETGKDVTDSGVPPTFRPRGCDGQRVSSIRIDASSPGLSSTLANSSRMTARSFSSSAGSMMGWRSMSARMSMVSIAAVSGTLA